MSNRLTIVNVSSHGCGNCRMFKPEWEIIKDRIQDEYPGMGIREYTVMRHEELPSALENTVPFYPFLMVTLTSHLKDNLTTTDPTFRLEGEVLYAIRCTKYDDMGRRIIKYVIGGSADEAPSMRYPRTVTGVMEWIRDIAIPGVESMINQGVYGDEVEQPAQRVQMSALTENRRMLMENLNIPSLNKEYTVCPGGKVMCRRIRGKA